MKVREHRRCASPNGFVETVDALKAQPGGACLRFLLVDDNSSDRLLLSRELTREFPEAAIIEASTPDALETVLSGNSSIDLLITDFQLVWTDGIAVIRQARQRWPELPAIMFTGTGNEEVAVQAMKAGVQDYLLKAPRNYGRLMTAVRTALNSRAEKQSFVAAESRYAALFNTVPVGLFRATPHGTLLDANPAFAAILGCGREELVGRSFAELHPGKSDFSDWRDQLEREGSVAWVESRFRTVQGEIKWVEIHAKALRDPVTQEVIYEGSVEDVTRDKAAEAERDQLIERLQVALGKVRTLTGLLPICSSCKKIRDDHGRWNILESFIENHSHAHFTHSFCPECARRLYPEVFLDTPKF